jgi:predicted transposase/invertase (TIGR01784 family)
MKQRYVNPFTDFGFKKLFGEEASKPHLIDFLNALLPAHARIRDLDFRNHEMLGSGIVDRKAIFDIYCEGVNGERFIVEMQKAKQNYFKERTVFYSTFPIQEQAEKGVWDYQLQPVYCVGLLDFTFEDYETETERSEVVHEIKLKNQNNAIFYDKLTYIYLEIPNFHKEESELESRLDKWLYFIKHLVDLTEIPRIFGGEDVFVSAFHKAELVNLDPTEKASYEASLKVYRDLKGVIDTAREEGRMEGELIGLEKGVNLGMEKAAAQLVARGMTEAEARSMLGLD